MSTNTQKLRVLRARTDFDLVVLVQWELARGLSLVDLATTRNSPLFAQAEKALAAATALLPRISSLTIQDRLRIQARVQELRSRLDGMPTYANLRPYPASVAS